MKNSKRVLVWIVVVLGVLFAAIQLVPVDRSNPASQTQVPADTQARAVLSRACYDCHSNETKWPWYSYVAPVSWLVARDVNEGRAKLNFSTWNLLSAEQQSEAFKESWEKVQEGEMPLWFYLPLHPSAKLSPTDRAVLQAWAASAGTTSATGGGIDPGTGAGIDSVSGTGSDSTGATGSELGTTDTGAGTTSVPSGGGGSLGVGGAGESGAYGDVDNDGDND